MPQNVVDIIIRLQKQGTAQTAIAELQQLSRASAMLVPAAAGVLAIGAGMAAVSVAARGLSAVGDAVKGVGTAAFEAVRSYEMLNFSVTQLTATQLVQAGAASTMAAALTAAKGPAADLLNWMQQLAIESPFTMDQVARSFQVAQAFGFGAHEAQRLTQDLIDLASASGKDSETLGRITLSLGQIFTQGKVTEREMRELALAGIPIKQVLADSLGVTTHKLEQMITDGAVPAIDAIRGLEAFIETNFAGAAKRAMNTWQGLITSLQDIKQMDLRVLFTGMFDAIKPEAISVVNWLQSAEFKDRLTVVGTELATSLKASILTVKDEFGALDKAGAFDNLKGLVGSLSAGSEGIPGVMKGVSTALGIATVDANLFGQAFVASMDTALRANEIFFNAALSGFNILAAVWNSFARSIGAGAAAIGAAASGDWLNVAGYVGEAQQALADIGTSADTGASIFTGATGEMVSAAQTLIDKLGALKTAHGEQVSAVLAAAQSWQTYLDVANGKTASYLPGQEPKPKASPWDFKGWNITSFMPDTTKWGTTAGNAMGDAAAKRIASAFTSLADRISNAITDASQKAKKLWDASSPTAPGTNIWEPGGNGPFERLYRITDVAAHGAAQRPDQPGYWRTNKETGEKQWVPPVETQRFMKQEGVSQPQALEIARAFQMNNLLAPGVFERVDWKQLASLSLQEQEGSKQTKYGGMAAAALLSAGKEVTPESMRAMIDDMAKSDKAAVVPNLQDIRAAVDSMKTTTDADLVLVLGALGKIEGKLPGPTPPTPPSGPETSTKTKPGTVTAMAAGGVAPGGLTLVGERGPELVDLPAGSRVYMHTALETQQALAQRSAAGPSGQVAPFGLLPAIGAAPQAVRAAVSTFASMLTGRDQPVGSPNALQGLMAMFTPPMMRVPAFAGGTSYAPGGLSLTGEDGPELVHLPGPVRRNRAGLKIQQTSADDIVSAMLDGLRIDPDELRRSSAQLRSSLVAQSATHVMKQMLKTLDH